jgi:hypothetical protein
MTDIDEFDLSIRQILLEGLSPSRNEEDVVPPQYYQQRHLRRAKILMKLVVECDVALLIHEEIELDVLVPRPLHERIFEGVRLWSDGVGSAVPFTY